LTVQIRELTASDATEFQALRLRSLLELPSAFSSSYEEESELALGFIAGRISPSAERCVFGAIEDSRLVGILGLQRERHQKLAHKAFIWGVFVAPHCRKSGIGRALLSAALARAARMSGLRQVNLSVNAANAPALALYESFAFKSFGIERGFMLLNGELHDEVHMVHCLAAT
jgi:RimJ/RimL family protein N-acetyltransferase